MGDSLEGLTSALRDSIAPRTGCRALCLYTTHHINKTSLLRVTSTEQGTVSDVIPESDGLVGAMLQSKHSADSPPASLNIADCQRYLGYKATVDRPLGVPDMAGAMLAIPICDANGNVSGVLVQYDKEGVPKFSAVDEEYSASVAALLDVALKNVARVLMGEAALQQSNATITSLEEQLAQEAKMKAFREEMTRERERVEAERAREEEERVAVEDRKRAEARLRQQEIDMQEEKETEAAAELAGMPYDLYDKFKDPKFTRVLAQLGEWCGVEKSSGELDAQGAEELVRRMKRLVQNTHDDS